MAVPASFFQRDLARLGLAKSLASGFAAGGGMFTVAIQQNATALKVVFALGIDTFLQIFTREHVKLLIVSVLLKQLMPLCLLS
jgi:hypothetical protein